MATIGYLREPKNMQILNRNLQQMRSEGISLTSIIVGGDIVKVIDSLACGDCLVVNSVTELSSQVARQQILLKRIADRGITFRPLNKTKTRPVAEPGNFMDRLLRYLGVRHPKRNYSAPTTEFQGSPDERNRIINDCLKSYYGQKTNVETICENARIPPRLLYDFLQKNNLPSRREVKSNPKLNPQRRPGFPDSLFTKDSGGKA